jgi:hypothetical protein
VANEQEFFSFDEALDELRLKEEELKRLVSEGEIRAFREGDTMKLRREDIEVLRAELSGGEIVDLGESAEELIFEDDTDLDEGGMATQEIADVDTLIEEVEDVGELELEEPQRAVSSRAVRRSTSAAALSTGATGVATSGVVVVEESEEPTMVRIALIATAFILLLALPVAVSSASGNLSSLAQSIAGIFSSGLSDG